jgi:filamentous hemagglutinin family protein
MRRPKFALQWIALAIGALPWHQALANPTGPTPVRGVASISGLGTSSVTVNTNSAKAIINWQGFSLDPGDLTRFNQPSATAAVLNRVTSTQPSVIVGTLQSNGRVFLVNPNGVVFTFGHSVDVAGLVASSLNITDNDFISGRMRFSANPDAPTTGVSFATGRVSARGGGIYVIGQTVSVVGGVRPTNLESAEGDVVLAAGTKVEVLNPATPNVTVNITAGPGNTIGNSGFISGGRISMFAGVIDIAGDALVSAATAIPGANGTVTLRATGDINLGPNPAVIFPIGPRIEASKRVRMIAGGNITMSCPECAADVIPGAEAQVRGGDIFLKGKDITQGLNASLVGRRLTIAASGDVDLANSSNSVARFGGRASGDVVFNNTSPTLKVDGLKIRPPHSLSLAQDGDLKIKGNVISGPQTISATGNVLVTPGRTGGIVVYAEGPQSIESGGDMTIRGTRDRLALIASSDSTDLTVGGTLRLKRALIVDVGH